MKNMMAKQLKRERWIPFATAVLLVGWMLFVVAVSVSAADRVSTDAGPEGPAQTAYAPPEKPGPVIIVISGQSGPDSYQSYASELSKLGYYTVLLTGKDILNSELTGEANLKKAIDRAQRSPHAVPGKTAVIGFSLGGGGALYNATPLSDLVSVVVAYYPYTKTWANKMGWFVKRFQVPMLVMAAKLRPVPRLLRGRIDAGHGSGRETERKAIRTRCIPRGEPWIQSANGRQKRRTCRCLSSRR